VSSKIYITTSIAYVNAEPHVGFALELVQGDAIARYHRLLGGEVRFQTGTDENAYKNVLAARNTNLPVRAFVDQNAKRYRELLGALDISADSFVRTTEPRHRRAVTALWRRFREGDIYRKEYRGLYCTGCEDFYLEKDLIEGRCPEHATKPVEVAEEDYFFRLSRYQNQIERLLTDSTLHVIPETRRREVLSFVRGGLRDISVTRSAARCDGWGIPVPGDPSQIVYVWIDALINYISGPGFGSGNEWKQWWNSQVCKLHVIGKNVWKFHAIYWPAMLLSAGLPLPDRIVVHGFVTADGRKIGKSLGNTVDPFEFVDRFGTDPVRYYLLRAIPAFEDGDFSRQRLEQVYRVDLANGLGNLVSRLTALCHRAGFSRYDAQGPVAAPKGYHSAFERYEFDKAVASLWAVIDRVNQDIETTRPWELLKENRLSPLKEHLDRWLTELHRIAYWLTPFLPETSDRITKLLSADEIRPAAPIFPRLDQ
jgi:methionyl-tRNA synthetase